MQPITTITDWGQALLTSFSTALALIFQFIPKLIGFLVIMLVGWLVARALGKLVTVLLRKIGFDNFSNRIGLTRFEQRMLISWVKSSSGLSFLFSWYQHWNHSDSPQ